LIATELTLLRATVAPERCRRAGVGAVVALPGAADKTSAPGYGFVQVPVILAKCLQPMRKVV
jgi:hypothetical protein